MCACVQPVNVWKEEVAVTFDQFAACKISSETAFWNQEVGCCKGFRKKGSCSLLSQSSHSRYVVKRFHLPPQFFFCEVGAGIWSPPPAPPRTVSIKLSLECWTRPPEPTHTATLSSTQHLSPTASTEKETRSITLDSTAKRKEQWRVGGGGQAFYQQ